MVFGTTRRSKLALLCTFTWYSSKVLADPDDWVNPAYVLQASKDSKTAAARTTIIRAAEITAKKGPWTVYEEKSVKAPSGDVRDYLSWAPYHWPDCNWCNKGGRTHLSTGASNRTNSGDDADSSTTTDTAAESNDTDEVPAPSDGEASGDAASMDDVNSDDEDDEDDISLPIDIPGAVPIDKRRMIKRVRRSPDYTFGRREEPFVLAAPGDQNADTSLLPTPDLTVLVPTSTGPEPSQTSDRVISGTPSPAQAPAKTQKPKPKPKSTQKPHTTKTKGPTPTAKSSCTPSPTKSLPPSATWTTCPYVVRDGKVNPDVTLPSGSQNIVAMSQSVLYNALAYVFTNKESYSSAAASFVDKFFLDAKAGMHPEIKFGQTIRGPGAQHGQYLGILDFRGMVKVVNAIKIMKSAGARDWTPEREAQLRNWMTKYLEWLQTSDIGKKGGSAPNNHGTFYAAQLAALQYLVDDTAGASSTLSNYFKNQFLDQLAASGEQPFEAVRTRPFHYRCFNIEAMITSAKLGKELGLDLWNAKSKYGATIQTAVDYTLRQNPGKEEVSDIFPHVATVAAVYGDPNGKYEKFLRNNDKDYERTTYFFYDQPQALSGGSASGDGKGDKGGKAGKGGKSKNFREAIAEAKMKRQEEEGKTDIPNAQEILNGLEDAAEPPTPTMAEIPDEPLPTPTIPWECPAAFATATRVQLDDGVYVTCDQLKPFYGYAKNKLA